MFTQELLQELVAYTASNGGGVLSLYLNADSTQQSTEAIKLQVRGLLKSVAVEHGPEVATIEKYLDHSFDWSKPGLAIFAAEQGGFFRAYPVAVSFRNRLRIGKKPYLKPLAHFLDYYAHYGVILVDRLGARFFEYHLGELEAMEGFIGEDVHKLKKGGGSSAVGMRGGLGGGRHEEEVAQRNLREAAAAAEAFFHEKKARRLFLCGTPETVAQFRNLLSKQLQSCVADTCAMDMNAGEHEVRTRSLEMLRKNNEEREARVLADLFAAAARGAGGVLGLDETLQAVCDKRVQLLVLSDGYQTPGYLHEASGMVVANLARSPLSEKELTAVADVIDVAVTYTLAQGGRIEVISDNAELEQAGRVGAMLRY